jgi:hypothetical protein
LHSNLSFSETESIILVDLYETRGVRHFVTT